jgi:maltose-binding protein MalE
VIGPSDWTADLADARLLFALQPVIPADLRGRLPDAIWRLGQYNREVVAVPLALEQLALFYNKNTVQAPPATWDALVRQKVVLGKDFYHTAGLFFALGGRLMDDAGDSLMSQEDVLNNYLASINNLWRGAGQGEIGLLFDAPYTPFVAGEAVFLVENTTAYADLLRLVGAGLAVAPLPTIMNGAPWRPFVRAQNLFVLINSPRTDIALGFADYLTRPAAQNEVVAAGYLPANPQADLMDTPFAALDVAASVPIPNRREMAVYWAVMRDALEAVTVGDVTHTVVTRLTEETLKTRLAAFRGK